MNWKKPFVPAIIIAFIVAVSLINASAMQQADINFYNALSLGGLMVVLWISEAIPIYLTALIPWLAGPMLGLIDTKGLASCYGDRMVYLFFGGFIIALALEKWKIHLFVANAIINALGRSKPRVLFGFLMTTGFISMWVSNTATALMMLPMSIAIIDMLPEQERKGRFSVFILLSVAYGANIGGMGTIVGSPPNLQMANLLSKQFNTEVDFMEWFKIGMPVTLSMLLLVFGFFWLVLGKERKEFVANYSAEKHRLNSDQWKVIAVFAVVVTLWISKDYICGPGTWFPNLTIGDEGSAIFGVLALMLLPAKSGDSKNLLTWEDTKQLPWGILIMFGGGLALASCLEYGGVINQIAKLFGDNETISYFGILTMIVVIAVLGTELLSNLALVTLFVPIIAAFCQQNDLPLIDLCIPLTLAASCGFMMPVGTPPNAIAYSSGYISMNRMMLNGMVVNLIGMVAIVGFALMMYGG